MWIYEHAALTYVRIFIQNKNIVMVPIGADTVVRMKNTCVLILKICLYGYTFVRTYVRVHDIENAVKMLFWG